MNVICESCKQRMNDSNTCFRGFNQHTGRKDGIKGTIICERFSAKLKKMKTVPIKTCSCCGYVGYQDKICKNCGEQLCNIN